MDDVIGPLIELMHDFGEDWQIQPDAEVGAFVAVRRPTPTAQHILIAHDLSALREKLERAG
jgi:hypothetical protein